MKPFNPKEFTFEDAAHLLRRAGFGGSVAQVEGLQKLGVQNAVDQLLSFSSNDGTSGNPHDDLEPVFQASIQEGRPAQVAVARTIPTVQGWWMFKMIRSTQPLKEKLTLFWHGHFVSGLDKVRSGFALRQQNELFRRMGLGKFEALVLEVSKNPAMLRYLDNDKNTKKHPNENFARELMELFTMGVKGGYSERDVQESARAFTGWSVAQRRGNLDDLRNPEFVFKKNDHDTGLKAVLGQNGNFNGDDIVRITSNHPSTPMFIITKLWKFFVAPEITEKTLSDLVAVWKKSGGSIRDVLREMFTSEEFYAPANRYALIKSPLEYVVGALRACNVKPDPDQERGLIPPLSAMAQIPLYPPDVSGWDGDMDWIADTTMLNRLQFAGALNAGRLVAAKSPNNTGGGGQRDIKAQWVIGANLNETIDLIGKTYLGSSINGSLKKALETFAKGRNTPDVARGLAYLVMISPQYHLA
jgi:uncharacterized protein (DUF1800 family)